MIRFVFADRMVRIAEYFEDITKNSESLNDPEIMRIFTSLIREAQNIKKNIKEYTDIPDGQDQIDILGYNYIYSYIWEIFDIFFLKMKFLCILEMRVIGFHKSEIKIEGVHSEQPSKTCCICETCRIF